MSDIESLLIEYKSNRDQLRDMISEIEEVKKDIEKLLPKKLDARYKYFFEERVKTIVSMFNALLDIRKEISKSLKDELEFRRKLEMKDDDSDIESKLDIQALAKKVEKLQEKTEKTKEKVKTKTEKKQTQEIKKAGHKLQEVINDNSAVDSLL